LIKKYSKLLIMIFLVGAILTYVMPFMSISYARVGSVEFSFNDLVRLIPMPEFKEKKKMPEIDFGEMMKKISGLRSGAQKAEGSFNISPEAILGGLIPVALALAYSCALLSLIFVQFGKGFFLKKTLLVSVLASAYVVVAGTYLSAFVKKQVADSGTGILSVVTDLFSKGISVQTETGAYLLLTFTALAILVHFLRRV